LGCTIFATAYVSESLRPSKLAKYFFPFSKTCLNVSEYKPSVPSSTTDTQPGKDLEARHFNIETAATDSVFKSTISISPEQKVVGLGLFVRQTLFSFCDDTPRVWLDVIMPIEKVTNKLHFKEKIISTGGGAVDAIGLDNAPRVGSMTEALQQKTWKFGKINNNNRHKTGLADLDVRINWTNGAEQWCQRSSFVGVLVPTGTRINGAQAAYLFSPVIGNNHHWGLTFGSLINAHVWAREEHKIRLIYQVYSAILVTNYQIRSLDIKDKQWGRYMEIYKDQKAATLASASGNARSGNSGINTFTKCMKVDPRYISTMSGTFMYEYKNFAAYAGYNLYLRHAEKVDLPEWTEHVALKSVNGVGATTLARSVGKNFPQSDITDPDDYTDAIVPISSLNFDSAAHPGVVSQTLFANIGYNTSFCDKPVFVGLGGSYEFSSANNALERLMGWVILSISL